MAKAKKKRTKKKVKAEWDPWYCKMLDAVAEYIDSISERENDNINERDHRIIRALIEFYGFDFDDVVEILNDIDIRVKQLEQEEKEKESH